MGFPLWPSWQSLTERVSLVQRLADVVTRIATEFKARRIRVATVNLGWPARRSGSFVLAGHAGLPVGAPVLMQLAPGPYAGKGLRADEAQMDRIQCVARVTSTSTVSVWWSASGRVGGNFIFSYQIGAA